MYKNSHFATKKLRDYYPGVPKTLGESSQHPNPLTGGKGTRCPLPKNLTPALRPSA